MSVVDVVLGFLIACLIVDRVRLEGRLAWRELGWDKSPTEESCDE